MFLYNIRLIGPRLLGVVSPPTPVDWTKRRLGAAEWNMNQGDSTGLEQTIEDFATHRPEIRDGTRAANSYLLGLLIFQHALALVYRPADELRRAREAAAGHARVGELEPGIHRRLQDRRLRVAHHLVGSTLPIDLDLWIRAGQRVGRRRRHAGPCSGTRRADPSFLRSFPTGPPAPLRQEKTPLVIHATAIAWRASDSSSCLASSTHRRTLWPAPAGAAPVLSSAGGAATGDATAVAAEGPAEAALSTTAAPAAGDGNASSPCSFSQKSIRSSAPAVLLRARGVAFRLSKLSPSVI